MKMRSYLKDGLVAFKKLQSWQLSQKEQHIMGLHVKFNVEISRGEGRVNSMSLD